MAAATCCARTPSFSAMRRSIGFINFELFSRGGEIAQAAFLSYPRRTGQHAVQILLTKWPGGYARSWRWRNCGVDPIAVSRISTTSGRYRRAPVELEPESEPAGRARHWLPPRGPVTRR